MNNFLQNSVFFGVFISIITYEIGVLIKKKLKIAIFNPLLISMALIIIFLLIFHVDYDTYESGAKYLSYFLTPATVALAVPLYEQIEPLKKNWKAILAGIFAGAMTSALCVLVLSLIFKLSHKQYVTLLPKSITTAIGMGLSEELGGIVTITVAVIIVTGVIGNMFAENICKLFHISDPVAKGVGIGSASHAMGTSKAMEMGEIEGAMSSLSIAVSGLLTVVFPLAAHWCWWTALFLPAHWYHLQLFRLQSFPLSHNQSTHPAEHYMQKRRIKRLLRCLQPIFPPSARLPPEGYHPQKPASHDT